MKRPNKLKSSSGSRTAASETLTGPVTLSLSHFRGAVQSVTHVSGTDPGVGLH